MSAVRLDCCNDYIDAKGGGWYYVYPAGHWDRGHYLCWEHFKARLEESGKTEEEAEAIIDRCGGDYEEAHED